LLPFLFERPKRYQPEEIIYTQLVAQRGAVW
jgi:hypothetical protein